MSAKKPSTEAGEREFETELAQWEKIRHTRESALLEDYLRQYPGGRFSELAQFRLDQVLQLHGEKRIQTATVAAANPLSKGTAVADVSYTIGDRYAYRRVDALTKAEDRRYTLRVTQVTDTEVMYNEGANITDLLGNIIKNPRRDFTGIRQFYVPEYSIGKKWKTRFHAESKDLGVNKTWIVDAEFKVVAKDQVTVPAGTFDAYKVEGRGSNTLGQRLVLNYWIAPDRVRAPLMLESIFYNNKGTVFESSRDELVSYTQLRQPGEVK